MKREIYVVLLLGIFLVSSPLFNIMLDSSESGDEHVAENSGGLVFENMGRKTLTIISETYNVTVEDLITELGLPADIDPETKVRDLPFDTDPGEVVEEAIIRMKTDHENLG